jgi:hypothetical protein
LHPVSSFFAISVLIDILFLFDLGISHWSVSFVSIRTYDCKWP